MRVFRYQLPLAIPIELGGQIHAQREGLLLQTQWGWGEAAPLPGVSRESLADVRAAWRTGPPFDLPSLQFAYDSACRPLTAVSVPINALLAGSKEQVITRARQLANAKCCAVKVKVGRGTDLDRDIGLVRKVRQLLRTDQRLRLDANRAWDESTAIAFGHALAGCDIEYIEEPVADPAKLEEFYRQTGIPYALDETLSERTALEAFPNAVAFVCKPTMLGGMDHLQRLAATGKPLVLSASFESGIGVARIAQWASQLAPGLPAGLDTYSWIGKDVLTSRLEITDWNLTVPTGLAVNQSLLVELS